GRGIARTDLRFAADRHPGSGAHDLRGAARSILRSRECAPKVSLQGAMAIGTTTAFRASSVIVIAHFPAAIGVTRSAALRGRSPTTVKFAMPLHVPVCLRPYMPSGSTTD